MFKNIQKIKKASRFTNIEDIKTANNQRLKKVENGSCNPCFPCELLGFAAFLGSCYGLYHLATDCYYCDGCSNDCSNDCAFPNDYSYLGLGNSLL